MRDLKARYRGSVLGLRWLAYQGVLLYNRIPLLGVFEGIAVVAALALVNHRPGMHGFTMRSARVCPFQVVVCGRGLRHGDPLLGAIDRRGVLIGLFFALTFAAGHLNQEARDYEGDRLNGILTNGVRFGRKQIFLAGFWLFTLAYGHLFWLAHTGLLAAPLRYLILLYPLHTALFWRTFREGLSFQSISRFQATYRLLYSLIGLAMGATLLLW